MRSDIRLKLIDECYPLARRPTAETVFVSRCNSLEAMAEAAGIKSPSVQGDDKVGQPSAMTDENGEPLAMHHRPMEDVLKEYNSDADKGLTKAAAEELLKKWGPNELESLGIARPASQQATRPAMTRPVTHHAGSRPGSRAWRRSSRPGSRGDVQGLKESLLGSL